MTQKDAPLLQRLGLEAREHDPEVWLRAVYWAIEDARPAIAVITDVRFENEAEFVRGMGGTLVRVSRVIRGRRALRGPVTAGDSRLRNGAGRLHRLAPRHRGVIAGTGARARPRVLRSVLLERVA
jgi:hypothetical protein